MAKTAESIGANTFQFFTRNPRGGKAKAIDKDDINLFLDYAKEHDISNILAHAPYTLNACSADEKIREFALQTMTDDIDRMELIPGNMYNFHPGSHVKQGSKRGIELITELLNKVLFPEMTTTVLLETMAGKGTEVGRSLKNFAALLTAVSSKIK